MRAISDYIQIHLREALPIYICSGWRTEGGYLHGSGALNGQLLSKGHRKQARVELGCLGEKDLEDPKVTEVVRLCGSPPTEVPKGPAEQGRSDVPQAGLTAKGRFDSRQSWLSSRQGQ